MKKIIFGFLHIVVNLILLITVGLIFVTAVSPLNAVRFYTVMSGSMAPSIKVGSLVISERTSIDSLKIADVISFHPDIKSPITVTHRIDNIAQNNGKIQFLTKGDANQKADAETISAGQITGKIIFSVPFLGFISAWLKQPIGFILAVIVPAVLLIIMELWNIKKAIEENILKKYKIRDSIDQDLAVNKSHFIKNPYHKLYIKTILLFFFVSSSFFVLNADQIKAYFHDMATSEPNIFLTAEVFPGPTGGSGPTGATGPTGESGPSGPSGIANNLVINEIYYDVDTSHTFGNEKNSEWVEIFNPTTSSIDLTDWTIEDNNGSTNLNGNVPANSFLLIIATDSATFQTKWSIPLGTNFYQDSTGIGGSYGLANGGDFLKLMNNSLVVDEIGWGNISPESIAGCSTNCPEVTEGHSLERNPTAYDTDSTGDFVDRDPPTPGT